VEFDMSLDDLGAQILKAMGDGLSTRNQHLRLFDTGFPPLNRIISGSYSGGIPSGRVVEIYGPSQSGKTHLATEIMLSVQKMGGTAIFLDHERRFVPDFAIRRGLNIAAPHFFYQRPWTWEESNSKALAIAQMLRESNDFPDDAPIVAVLDSVASANPRSKVGEAGATGKDGAKAKEMEFSMADTTALARATSATMPVMAAFCDKLDLTMIYLNQVREKPGIAYGDPTTTPGGKAMGFYADVRIQLSKSVERDDGKGKEAIGQIITAKAIKAVTAPFKTTSWTLRFDQDGDTIFDREASLIDHMVQAGIIATPTKGFIEWEGNKIRKSSLIEAIRSVPDGYEKLVALLPK
jgi:protein RecA